MLRLKCKTEDRGLICELFVVFLLVYQGLFVPHKQYH